MSLLVAALFVAGLGVAAWASRRAVTAALQAAAAANVSAGLIGMTVLAVGTDLPEIANSIIAALTDHGDVVVGDAAGSAVTQVTLVLAVLCLVQLLHAEQRTIAWLGAMTAAALLLGARLVGDGWFSRTDGLVLVAAWVVGLVITRVAGGPGDVEPPSGERVAPAAVAALGWLVVVAAAATVVVRSFVHLTDAIGVPELVASAVVLSLGTSLPELVVDLTAIRRGAAALALGDLFGSSLLDATLAIGIGPALRATPVSAGAATTCLLAAVGVALATAVIASSRTHRFRSASLLLVVYGAVMTAMVVTTG